MIPSPRAWSLLALALLAAGCPGDDGSATGQESEGSSTTLATTGPTTTTGVDISCNPGDVRCSDDASAIERCAPTGQDWLPEACPSKTTCQSCDADNCAEASACIGPCDSVDDLPSSAGCSFIANRQILREQKFFDSLIVANPNSSEAATVQLYQAPEGTNIEKPLGMPITLQPLESTVFELDTNFVVSDTSAFRTGGIYRVQSDEPIVAYHHAPGQLSNGNDSSLLFPETALRQDYIAISYAPHEPLGGQPSYFEVVALENFTTLEWTPPVDTAGNGLPVPFVAAGETGKLKMNRFDTVRIAASGNNEDDPNLRDVSGTLVHADKPIWMTSGTKCSRVPVREEPYHVGHCDPLQEMPIPLAYWGTKYVAPASPGRLDLEQEGAPQDDPQLGKERHHWRIFAGADDVMITTDPELPDTPIMLAKRGDYVDFSVPNQVSFVMESNRVFMPVQYLQAQHRGDNPDGSGPWEPEELVEYTNVGDPAMYQMVPVEQFLETYVFVTAIGFPQNYVQIIRAAGSSGVRLDGELVSAYIPINSEWQLATVRLEQEGPHIVESEDEFGILQVGYSTDTPNEACLKDDVDPEEDMPPYKCLSSYAYPGGMRSEQIYTP